MLCALTLTLFAGLVPASQDSRPVLPVAPVAAGQPGELQAEFYTLLGHFENAIEGYYFDQREAQRLGKPRSEWPAYPAAAYFDRFLALAERGSPWSMAWVIENLEFRFTETEVVIRESKRWYEQLFRGSPNHDSLLRATRLFPTAANALGQEYVLELLRELHEKTTRADVKGNTLWGIGTALRIGGDEDGAILMFEQLVRAFPEAPLASAAAIELYDDYQAQFLGALTLWANELETDPDALAASPVERFAEQMKPLASTGILQARQWTSDFYPKWQAASALGAGQALQALTDYCVTFQGALQGPWIDLMVRLRGWLVTRFQGQPWVQAGLHTFVDHCFLTRYQPQVLAPFFEVLAGVAKTETERAAVSFGRAMLDARGRDLADLKAALAGYTTYLAEFPKAHWSEVAQREFDSLTRVMPGSLLELAGRGPDGASIDLTQFRGSIVLVDFFSFNSDACDERLRLEAQALHRWADKPVVILGVSLDSLVGPSFKQRAQAHGLTWPCLSDLALRGQFASKWHVRYFPTAIVVDREGLIVTRNEPWEKTVSAIDQLLAE